MSLDGGLSDLIGAFSLFIVMIMVWICGTGCMQGFMGSWGLRGVWLVFLDRF